MKLDQLTPKAQKAILAKVEEIIEINLRLVDFHLDNGASRYNLEDDFIVALTHDGNSDFLLKQFSEIDEDNNRESGYITNEAALQQMDLNPEILSDEELNDEIFELAKKRYAEALTAQYPEIE